MTNQPPLAEEGRALPPLDVEIEGALVEQRTIFNDAPASSDSTEGRWFYRTLVCLSHMTSLIHRLRAASPAPAVDVNQELLDALKEASHMIFGELYPDHPTVVQVRQALERAGAK